jgi:hypothetical protein
MHAFPAIFCQHLVVKKVVEVRKVKYIQYRIFFHSVIVYE